MSNKDINSQILSAFISDRAQDEVETIVRPDIEDQKQYLCCNMDSVSLADKKEICNIVSMNDKRGSLLPYAAGTLVNLDTLPDDIVQQMYDLLYYKKHK